MAEAPAEPAPPLFCGDIGIRIAADGTWFHEGRPIARPSLVALFARVLRREADGGYWLVTPVERARIAVDDSPFVAVEMERRGSGEGQRLRFRTNLDEWVEAGTAHPLRFRPRPAATGKAPYLALRDGLEARVARAAWYAGSAGSAMTSRGDRRTPANALPASGRCLSRLRGPLPVGRTSALTPSGAPAPPDTPLPPSAAT